MMLASSPEFYDVVTAGVWRAQQSYVPRSAFVWTGWSPPPHPIDVVPSYDSNASAQDRAEAVLWDFGHDDDVRAWASDSSVMQAFGVKKKEDIDPADLIDAYEHRVAPVWRKPGVSWQKLDAAVKKAEQKRAKLGPLPSSNYAGDPIEIYYYDNDWMKRVRYPRADLKTAMNPSNLYWWRGGGIGTWQRDPNTHQWGNEGFDWDKDVVGNVAQITSIIMQIVGSILTATGFLSEAGLALLALSEIVIIAMASSLDNAFQKGDVGSAVDIIGEALLQAAAVGLKAETGIDIPPEAMKALGQGVKALAADIDKGQKSGVTFAEAWQKILAQKDKYGAMGDKEAHAIEVLLGENSSGMVFRKGYDAAQLTDLATLGAIGQILADPAAAHLFMLGGGIGALAKAQKHGGGVPARPPQKTSVPLQQMIHSSSATSSPARAALHTFVTQVLTPRYHL